MPSKKNLTVKTGIFGGSFDPFHFGHLNSLLTVKEKFSLDQVIVIPAFCSPFRKKKPEAESFHRLNMLKKCFAPYSFVQIDDQEIYRKGISYTDQTVINLSKKKSLGNLFLIMGLDQFQKFDSWRNFSKILEKTNLVVTSRAGMSFPKKISDFPKDLIPFLKKKSFRKVSLKHSEKEIYFCSLKDQDISSSFCEKEMERETFFRALSS